MEMKLQRLVFNMPEAQRDGDLDEFEGFHDGDFVILGSFNWSSMPSCTMQ